MHYSTANLSRFTFSIAQPDDSAEVLNDLRVYQFELQEHISTHFRLTLEFVTENHCLEPEQLLNRAARLRIHGEPDSHYVNGIISEAAYMETGSRFARYSVTLRPIPWLLNYRKGCRIFQGLSVPEIVSKIFDQAGLMASIHYQWQTDRDYPKRTYCTQYNETEWDFIARLLAQEGIHFHYQHSVDKHLMVLGDSKTAFSSIEPDINVPFHHNAGLNQQQQHINQFAFSRYITTGKASSRDYNFTTPSHTLDVSHQANDRPALEQYHYPGQYQDEQQGQRYAQLKQEYYNCQRQTGSAQSNVPRIRAGQLFTLSGHPYQLNNREHLITGVSHFGRQPQSLEEDMPSANSEETYYYNKFDTIPGNSIFRPKLINEKPLIHGQQYAFVTGPEDEEIYVNEHGQIKVQFLWDREGRQNEQTTTWLRVSNEQAGKKWGQAMPPRTSQQILVEFEGGDPDRPIISGRCYNGDSLPPYPLPTHKTRSTTKSNSTPGGEGYNEIRFEDAKAREQIFVHSEKDLDIRCKNDRREYIGNNRSLIVDNEQFEHIKTDNHQIIAQNRYQKVGTDFLQDIGTALHIQTGQNYLQSAGNEIHIKAQSTLLDAGSELTFKASGGFIKIDPAGVTINGIKVDFNSGGNATSAASPSTAAPAQAQEADRDSPGYNSKVVTPKAPYQMAKLDEEVSDG